MLQRWLKGMILLTTEAKVTPRVQQGVNSCSVMCIPNLLSQQASVPVGPVGRLDPEAVPFQVGEVLLHGVPKAVIRRRVEEDLHTEAEEGAVGDSRLIAKEVVLVSQKIRDGLQVLSAQESDLKCKVRHRNVNAALSKGIEAGAVAPRPWCAARCLGRGIA